VSSIVPGERWGFKNPELLDDPEKAQYVFVLVVDKDEVLVDALTSGLCIANLKEFKQHFRKDYDEDENQPPPGPVAQWLKKRFKRLASSKCKHGVLILIDDNINRECKECHQN
jgi:hypothetical protein